jgi:type I restriction enzyme M protein
LLRLPTGIWYSPGVKANVLFFDKKPLTATHATKELWVYDLRSNQNFSLRQTPIQSDDLGDFIRSYCAEDRARRKESPLFRRFTFSEIIERDKANLDIHWQDPATNGTERQTPQALMKEILSDLNEAMREFAAAESELDD